MKHPPSTFLVGDEAHGTRYVLAHVTHVTRNGFLITVEAAGRTDMFAYSVEQAELIHQRLIAALDAFWAGS